jgi:lysophospholipase L1-like esterase
MERRKRNRLVAIVVALAIVAVAVAVLVRSCDEPAESAPLDPNPGASFQIVALGDSYISGEGARSFFPGTSVPRRNMCHRAATAYPYLVAKRLDASLVFVACSGAETVEVTEHGQYPDSGEAEYGEVYGARPQLEVEREFDEADVVLISIGGNDAGFAEIGMQCAAPTRPDCRRLADGWLRRLETDVYPKLVRTYTQVREAAPEADVFAMTYPNPFGPRFCRDLVGLDPAEMAFIREVFVGRLNELARTAAEAAGIRSVDLTDSLVGHRFCEVPLGKTAINFVNFSHTQGVPLDVTKLGGLFHGSLHPNPLGHELFEKKVLPQVEAARDGTLPPAPQPEPDKKPPPFTPAEIGLPGAAHPFPQDTACDGTELETVTQVSATAGQREIELTEVRPRSTVCFRTYRDRWGARQAGADGSVRVPIDVGSGGVGSINEIVVQGADGSWKEIVVSRYSPGEGG